MTKKERIIELMEGKEIGLLNAKQIAEYTGYSTRSIKEILPQLEKEGILRRTKCGKHKLAL